MSESPEVSIARLEVKVDSLFNAIEGLERTVAIQGSDFSEIKADLASLKTSVDTRLDAEGRAATVWRTGHEQKHKDDTSRGRWVIGIIAGLLLVGTGLIGYFVH